MFVGTMTILCVIALMGGAFLLMPLFDKWCDAKGIKEETGVDYGNE